MIKKRNSASIEENFLLKTNKIKKQTAPLPTKKIGQKKNSNFFIKIGSNDVGQEVKKKYPQKFKFLEPYFIKNLLHPESPSPVASTDSVGVHFLSKNKKRFFSIEKNYRGKKKALVGTTRGAKLKKDGSAHNKKFLIKNKLSKRIKSELRTEQHISDKFCILTPTILLFYLFQTYGNTILHQSNSLPPHVCRLQQLPKIGYVRKQPINKKGDPFVRLCKAYARQSDSLAAKRLSIIFIKKFCKKKLIVLQNYLHKTYQQHLLVGLRVSNTSNLKYSKILQKIASEDIVSDKFLALLFYRAYSFWPQGTSPFVGGSAAKLTDQSNRPCRSEGVFFFKKISSLASSTTIHQPPVPLLRRQPNLFFLSLNTDNKGEEVFFSKNIPTKYFFNYPNYFENIISLFYKTRTDLNFIKINGISKSAQFILEEILYFLEKRVAYNKIKGQLKKEFLKNPSCWKGIRISYSGRLGGKTNKAERKKIDTWAFGQTSLHILSSNVDFAAGHAETKFGCAGVKVWIASKKKS